jgi:hypothetical protein
MAANQVDSVTEACILPVRVPPAVQPTIFRTDQDPPGCLPGIGSSKNGMYWDMKL